MCAAACWSECNVPKKKQLRLNKNLTSNLLWNWVNYKCNLVLCNFLNQYSKKVSISGLMEFCKVLKPQVHRVLQHRLCRCLTYQHTVSKHKDEEHIWMTFDVELDVEFVAWCRIHVGQCHKFLSLSNFQYCILLVCAMKFLDRLWSGDAGML